MPLTPGQVLQGRYRIVKWIGGGGFGNVYRAWDVRFSVPWALKESTDVSPEAAAQFADEAKMLFALSHPGLPKVSDYFIEPGQGQYLVMEFIEGEDLQDKLNKAGSPLPLGQAINWIMQALEALEYLHNRQPPVIHRDIKPANIVVNPQGKAVLVDFGIAKVDPSGKTRAGARAITPGYSPVEQYSLSGTDQRSDIYALGATLYALLCGKTPPESTDRSQGLALDALRSLNPAVSPVLEGVVLKAMGVRKEDRYPSVATFKLALREALAPPPQPKPAPTPQPTPAPPPAARQAIPPTVQASAYSVSAAIQKMQDSNSPIKERAAAADALDKMGWLLPDVYQFAQIGKDGEQLFWIGKCPVTNAQYQRFVQSENFSDPDLWRGFPAFDEHSQPMFGGILRNKVVDWKNQGWEWLEENAIVRQDGRTGRVTLPRNWSDPKFGIARRGVPVVGVCWYEANAYCRWLARHWAELEEGRANPDLRPKTIRLSTEAEWLLAAGRLRPEGRYPWDAPGKVTEDINEILRRANVSEAVLGGTTVLGMYPHGRSQPHGLWDLAGNVWEWQANYYDKDRRWLSWRGGAWDYGGDLASSAFSGYYNPGSFWDDFGFRVAAFPS